MCLKQKCDVDETEISYTLSNCYREGRRLEGEGRKEGRSEGCYWASRGGAARASGSAKARDPAPTKSRHLPKGGATPSF